MDWVEVNPRWSELGSVKASPFFVVGGGFLERGLGRPPATLDDAAAEVLLVLYQGVTEAGVIRVAPQLVLLAHPARESIHHSTVSAVASPLLNW